jgi:hypothetical protein
VRVPIAIEAAGNRRDLVCIEASHTDFVEPFFVDSLSTRFGIEVDSDDDESLVRRLRLENVRHTVVTRSSLADFSDQAETDDTLTPGFLFHTSRCGSTLVTQMLVASGRFVVLSEPTIVNQVLDPTGLISDHERIKVLRTTVRCLASLSGDRAVLVKLRSWNGLFANIIEEAFPDLKWMFLHRNGREILASVTARPPGWLRARKDCARAFSPLLGLPAASLVEMPADEYCCRLVGAICQAMMRMRQHGLILDYPEIAPEIGMIARHFGINLTSDELELCMARMAYDAKRPGSIVASDSAHKQASLTDHQRFLADHVIEPARLAYLR